MNQGLSIRVEVLQEAASRAFTSSARMTVRQVSPNQTRILYYLSYAEWRVEATMSDVWWQLGTVGGRFVGVQRVHIQGSSEAEKARAYLQHPRISSMLEKSILQVFKEADRKYLRWWLISQCFSLKMYLSWRRRHLFLGWPQSPVECAYWEPNQPRSKARGV